MSSPQRHSGVRAGRAIPAGARTGMARRLVELPPHQIPAAENWFTYGSRTPRAARRASSVCLVQDGVDGVETFLGYRSGESPLGSVAFPGGSVEAGDRAEYKWFGPSLTSWSKRLDVLDQQLVRVHLVCAIRELFEETGILLAGTDEQSVIEMSDPEEWMSAREAIAGQDLEFAEFLRRRGLGLRTDLLRPVSHWVSPNFAFRRFDTWYFGATVPLRQEPSLLRAKGRWAQWCSTEQIIEQRATSGLGDLIGQPNTQGLRLSQITSPAVELMLERMVDAHGVVAYLSRARSLDVQHPDLLVRDGTYYLEVLGNLGDESTRPWQAEPGH
ncbi:NUDIX hydrolase [Arthrobacter sp. MYb213]|uniref:NUDIX hydrolase n=1 Tax=Arthrobacter sp. MYb213 TaxID=1848595 RepID=UPI0025710926|nr:NUDIX hydrolase [Arthrobacter sp. MYb213]